MTSFALQHGFALCISSCCFYCFAALPLCRSAALLILCCCFCCVAAAALLLLCCCCCCFSVAVEAHTHSHSPTHPITLYLFLALAGERPSPQAQADALLHTVFPARPVQHRIGIVDWWSGCANADSVSDVFVIQCNWLLGLVV